MSRFWDIDAELKSLRWGPDMVITNYAGERVWLKTDEEYTYCITDCCLEDDPCPKHREQPK